MKKTFLYRLYINHKITFYFIIIFIIGQMFFTYKGVEMFPFLNYGMYSEYFQKSDTLEVIKFHREVTTDDFGVDESEFCLFGKPLLNYQEFIFNGDPISVVLKNRFHSDTTGHFYRYFHNHLINTKKSAIKFESFIRKTYRRKYSANLCCVTISKYFLSKDFTVKLIDSDTIIRLN